MMTQRSAILHPGVCMCYACCWPVESCLDCVQALDNLMAGRTTIVVVRDVILYVCCTVQPARNDAWP